MSRTFHHTRRADRQAPRPRPARRSERSELAEIISELSDADLALNHRVWGGAPESQSKSLMLDAINATLAERRSA